MKPLVLVGLLLVLLGLVGLVFGGISYTKSQETAELGPLNVTVAEKERLAIHPAIGAVVFAGGLLVL